MKAAAPRPATSGTDGPLSATTKKRQSGIPTGNAGEYFVMGELLKRGYDAQLADRNTKGYDILVGRPEGPALRKVQVKSVRTGAWYVRPEMFTGDLIDQVTIYVRLGEVAEPVRYFIAQNRDLAVYVVKRPNTAFMRLKDVEQYKGRWDLLESN